MYEINNPIESRGIPPQYLLPLIVQEVIDRKFDELYQAHGLTADLIASEDPQVLSMLNDSLYVPDRSGLESGPKPGSLVFEGNPFLNTHIRSIKNAVRVANIETHFQVAEVPMNSSFRTHDTFPFKTVALEEQQDANSHKETDVWFVQLTPDSPPMLFRNDDVAHVNRNPHKHEERGVQFTLSLIIRAFGPEAVVQLDDEESADIIRLLQSAEPYARVMDYDD